MQVVSLGFCKDKYDMSEQQRGMRYIFFQLLNIILSAGSLSISELVTL